MTSERADLAELGRYAFERLRRRLEGLTDEEFAWGPAPEVSSLAWRLGHIAALLTEERNGSWLGVAGVASARAAGEPASAEAAITQLEESFRHWSEVLDAVPEDSLDVLVGPAGGPYADSTRRAFVLHVLDELIHHGAEVGLVRDLWASRPG